MCGVGQGTSGLAGSDSLPENAYDVRPSLTVEEPNNRVEILLSRVWIIW